ncbi:MAG: hypothetical protein H6741_10620 [Alphaproteobacteria bacterium]|nr:hypothetical protein [Alphaproteobacteria bacterium]
MRKSHVLPLLPLALLQLGCQEDCPLPPPPCAVDSGEETHRTVFADADGDGFGDPIQPLELSVCDPLPAGHVENGDDCNDSDPSVNPAATEVCGGEDEDCDGLLDDEDDDLSREGAFIGYPDDGDGYGAADGELIVVCEASLVADNQEDCADDDPRRFPGAPERCNGLDDDCDGFDDTLLHWRFDEGEGDLVESDGGLGWAGEITDATWTDDGRSESALDFEGGQHVTVLGERWDLPIEDEASFSLFVRPESLKADEWAAALTAGSMSATDNSVYLGFRGEEVIFRMDAGSEHRVVTANGLDLVDGDWHHLLGTWTRSPDGDTDGEMRFYVDGELVGTANGPERFDDQAPLRVGVDTNNGDPSTYNVFDGAIDEVKLLSCAVNERQARADHLHNWPFRQP